MVKVHSGYESIYHVYLVNEEKKFILLKTSKNKWRKSLVKRGKYTKETVIYVINQRKLIMMLFEKVISSLQLKDEKCRLLGLTCLDCFF